MKAMVIKVVMVVALGLMMAGCDDGKAQLPERAGEIRTTEVKQLSAKEKMMQELGVRSDMAFEEFGKRMGG